MPKSTWRVFTISVTARICAPFVCCAFVPVAWCFGWFSSLSSVLAFEFGAGEDDRPFRLWPMHMSPCACLSWLNLHDSPFEHCPCALLWKHSSTFPPTQAFFPFWPLVTDRLSTPSFRTLQLRVLIIWPIWSFTDVFDRKKLVCPLFRTVSWSYNAKTVWSWTESCNFDVVQSFQDHIGSHVACW